MLLWNQGVFLELQMRPYGRADVIAGVGYVESTFMGVAGIPLVPVRSYFVIEDTGEVIEIPFHLRSVLLVYLRLATCIVGIASVATGLFVGLAETAIDHPFVGIGVGLGFMLVGALVTASTWLLQSRLERVAPHRRSELLARLQPLGIST